MLLEIKLVQRKGEVPFTSHHDHCQPKCLRLSLSKPVFFCQITLLKIMPINSYIDTIHSKIPADRTFFCSDTVFLEKYCLFRYSSDY
jgi:hypothetical protein